MASGPAAPTIRVELTPYSAFAATPAYQVQAELDTGLETVVVFGLRRHLVVPDPSDELFTVPTGGRGRLDLISQKFYGTPELGAAIADCNPSLDPMIDPQVGQVIAVPTRSRLAALGIASL
jgi:hypothetical protein